MQNPEKEFIDMINAHRGIIYKVCYLYVHTADERDDLFQEIVFQLWKSFAGFRGESKRSTWMYRVALNTAISQFRIERRKPAQHPLSVDDFQIPDVSESRIADESIMVLTEAIQLLSRVEKAIIMLYLEEKSYQEISDIMGITHSNVGVKINRIKSKLEKIIKQKTV